MATHEPRLTAATVESPLPRDWHGGFGERPGETDWWQHRHCAPGRLNSRIRRTPASAMSDAMALLTLAGSRGLPVRAVNTKPVSVHRSPAIKRSAA